MVETLDFMIDSIDFIAEDETKKGLTFVQTKGRLSTAVQKSAKARIP